MNTKFDEIYGLFLSSVDDYDLANVDDEELTYVLENYLKNGLGHLLNGARNFIDFDDEAKEFKTELSAIEKLAVAKAMKLEWISSKKSSQELMEKAIGDRDYKAIQGTDYIKELTKAEKEAREEINRILIDYSYSDEEFLGGMA